MKILFIWNYIPTVKEKKPDINKGNNKITEHRVIFQRERQNS
jgi:hypothetical protein